MAVVSQPSPQELLAEVATLIEAGQYPPAIEKMRALRQMHPDLEGLDDAEFRAHVAFGWRLLEEREADPENLDHAWGEFDEALVLRPDDEEAREGQNQVILAQRWRQMEGCWGVDTECVRQSLEDIVGLSWDYRGGEAREKLYATLISIADDKLRTTGCQEAVPLLRHALQVNPIGSEVRQRLNACTPTPTLAPTRRPLPTPPPPTPPPSSPRDMPGPISPRATPGPIQ